jgi:hypothetical protein
MNKTYLSGRAAALSPEGHFIARSAFILLLCLPVMLAAQNNGVTVSNLAVSTGSPTTVTFNVSWSNTGMPKVWSDTVWVWIDYNENGKMERLSVISATLTATSAPDVGKVVEDAGNNQGVWVVGNARSAGAFSATVQLFTDEPNVGGMCVYASNYPPVGEYTSATKISFTGTPPYNIVLKDNSGGTKTHTESSPYTVPDGYTVQSFTDKTGAPGTLSCTPPVKQTLRASASAYCEGTGGVQFALNTTELGVTYQLYENNVPKSGATLTGSGSPATFSGFFEAGTYTAHTVPGGAFCPAEMASTVSVTIGQAGTDGQAPDATCGCASGTTACGGKCTSNRTYTTNDGSCTGSCKVAYVQLRNQCGDVVNPYYSTYPKNSCDSGCCKGNCTYVGHNEPSGCCSKYCERVGGDDNLCKWYCCD